MQRVALFGGAYSNWAAVEAVVADARRRGADAVWFLGDAGGFGPHPDRTVETLRELGVAAIQGNYDDSVGRGLDDCQCGYLDPRDNHFAALSYAYTLANTSAEHRTWLAALPTEARIEVGGRRVLLCHGSPRRQNEFLWGSTTPRGFVDRLRREHDTDWIACTHTGLPWVRPGLVNVGAVGRPANDGRRCAWYAWLEAGDDDVRVDLIAVGYRVEPVVEAMRAEGLPEEFVATLVTGWWTTCLEILPAKERAAGRY